MDFKISKKSKENLDAFMQEFKDEEARIKEKQRIDHLNFLKKYGFKSAQEVFDYIYNGHIIVDEFGDKLKLMDNGSIGHWSLWLSDDDCAVLSSFWKTQTKESFEVWMNRLFSEERCLENGYLNCWFKSK